MKMGEIMNTILCIQKMYSHTHTIYEVTNAEFTMVCGRVSVCVSKSQNMRNSWQKSWTLDENPRQKKLRGEWAKWMARQLRETCQKMRKVPLRKKYRKRNTYLKWFLHSSLLFPKKFKALIYCYIRNIWSYMSNK